MVTDAPPPYYLQNFERALAWLGQRYEELFDVEERAFFGEFAQLPMRSRALLVRMLMRKGPLFRASRLTYEEIGCPLQAATPLIPLGWIDPNPMLSIDELFAISTRSELERIFPDAASRKSARKSDWLETLRATHRQPRRFADWDSRPSVCVLHVTIVPLSERLRVMFFGNLHQDWSEFVLADLGVFTYEAVSLDPHARAFHQRADIDAWLALHACREALDALGQDDPLGPVAAAATAIAIDNAWLKTRRAKLLFRIGQCAEQRHEWDAALDIYERCSWPGARYRRMRVLERGARFEDAFALASHAATAPESEAECQRVTRILPRLQRRLRLRVPLVAPAPSVARDSLTLPRPAKPFSVEHAVRDHFDSPQAPVYYVENTLINSLFGLLCWEPVFAPIPGAFFHPFQRGPADLHAPDFKARRADEFARCLAQLDSDTYRETIARHFHGKAGIQSPFVHWAALTPDLLRLALGCLPAAHLKLWFARLLDDIRENRSGLPDLIRFWPRERRYELIEVKGPGDRLQDNQIRWIQYCVRHGMPVRVIDVRWAEAREAGAEQGEANEAEAVCAANATEADDATGPSA